MVKPNHSTTQDNTSKIRLGRKISQSPNSVVFNASDEELTVAHPGLYVSPIRYCPELTSNVLGYDSVSREIVDLGAQPKKRATPAATNQTVDLTPLESRLCALETRPEPVLDGFVTRDVLEQKLADRAPDDRHLGVRTLMATDIWSTGKIRAGGDIACEKDVHARSFRGDGSLLKGVVLSENLDGVHLRFDAVSNELEKLESECKRVRLEMSDGLTRAFSESSACRRDVENLQHDVKSHASSVDSLKGYVWNAKADSHAELTEMERTLGETFESRLVEIRKELDALRNRVQNAPPIVQELPAPKIIREVVDLDPIKSELFELTRRVRDVENKPDPVVPPFPEIPEPEKVDLRPMEMRITAIEERPVFEMPEIKFPAPPKYSLQDVIDQDPRAKTDVVFQKNIHMECAVDRLSEHGDASGIIDIGGFASVGAYAKANAGRASGHPGGLCVHTKRPNGPLARSFTVDGLGRASAVGGFVLPSVVVDEIRNPVPGLVVYDTVLDAVLVYKRTDGWVEINTLNK